MTGIELIAEERREQLEKHGYDAEHDAGFYNDSGELAQAALYVLVTLNPLCSPKTAATFWPITWKDSFADKFDKKDAIGKLKVAGALIAAEIDRLQVAQGKP